MGMMAREEIPGRPRRQSVAWSLLEQLAQAHEQLLREMETIDLITRADRPDDGPFASARWQISQASLRKRALVARIVDFLAARLDRDIGLSAKDVRTADQQLLRKSAAHVRFWSSSSIRQDWQGYCSASREIRMHMGEQILLEKRILAPLLIKAAQREIW